MNNYPAKIKDIANIMIFKNYKSKLKRGWGGVTSEKKNLTRLFDNLGTTLLSFRVEMLRPNCPYIRCFHRCLATVSSSSSQVQQPLNFLSGKRCDPLENIGNFTLKYPATGNPGKLDSNCHTKNVFRYFHLSIEALFRMTTLRN